MLTMNVTLYGLKNCDTCRKALKEIEGDGHNVTLIDVREDGMDPGLLAGLLAKHAHAPHIKTLLCGGFDTAAHDRGTIECVISNHKLSKPKRNINRQENICDCDEHELD